MEILVFASLVGWIPLCLVAFVLLPPRTAVMVGAIGGWVLLPPASIPLSGIPDYDKSMAIVVSLFLGTLIFQPMRLVEFRPRWFDLPVLCWCICPMISFMYNGSDLYAALACVVGVVTHWAAPYLVGRLYFGGLEGTRELAIGTVIGGLVCALPCLYEIKMSPILLDQVYRLSRFEGMRMGGWRPRIFFSTGLELGMWMTATSLIAVWLWKSSTLKRIGQFPFGSLLMPILVGTTVMCRATGATMLLAGGLFILWFCTRFNTKVLFLALVLLAPAYYALRIPNLWSGSNLVNLIDTFYSKERAGSLAYRFNCEDKLIANALGQPIWGWGGSGRAIIVDKSGRNMVATDGMWIIFLGTFGLAGVLCWTAMMLLPAFLFLRRFPVCQWTTPTVAPLAAVAMVQSLYMIDCLSNGFFNLVYLAASGGLICTLPSGFRSRSSVRNLDTSGQLVSPDQSRLGLQEVGSIPADTSEPSPDPSNAGGSLAPTSQERLADRYERLARTLKNQGHPAQAKAAWIHALDLLTGLASTHPGVPEYQRLRWNCANNFAWFLLNEPHPGVGEPLVALRLAGEATEADPECGTYWNTLGAACYRTGDAASAIMALERSMLLTDGGDAFDYLFLALAHAQLGHQEPAQAWNTRADLWMQEHECDHPDLCQLHKEVCVSLSCGHETSSVS